MTYENFVVKISEKKEDSSRKDIKKFTIRYALSLFSVSLSLSMIVTNIVGSFFGVVTMVLFLFLYIWSFDVFVDNPEYFEKANKIVKLWWLIALVVFTMCILLNIFII